MGTIDLRELRGDKIVLHYGGALTSVDAYTFANSLVAFADTARSINALINPSQSIEVRLEAIGPGSYRAVLRWAAKEIRGLFKSAPNQIFWIIIGLLISKYWDGEPIINVGPHEVVIEVGGDRIIVPREAYEKAEQVKNAPEVRKNLKRTFDVIEQDDAIENFGVTARLSDLTPLVQVSRQDFPIFTAPQLVIIETESRRSRSERATLVILKAWLTGGNRKWSFEWNGVPISAPIKDAEFLSKLEAREFLIGSGDALDVDLVFEQDLDPSLGIFVNDTATFVVAKVYRPLPRPPQGRLLLDE